MSASRWTCNQFEEMLPATTAGATSVSRRSCKWQEALLQMHADGATNGMPQCYHEWLRVLQRDSNDIAKGIQRSKRWCRRRHLTCSDDDPLLHHLPCWWPHGGPGPPLGQGDKCDGLGHNPMRGPPNNLLNAHNLFFEHIRK